ncbi:MAG TPA: hypothetical protein VH299_14575 [Solirubrobacterales bacterium]|jgi:hypothetical protein|nr:hypothetical protein [Solirubrobacterales bacterium]
MAGRAAESRDGRRGTIRLAVAAVVILVAVAVGAVGGRLIGGGADQAPPAASGVKLTPPAGDHTAQGAAAAVAADERGFGSPSVLSISGLRRKVDEVATPAFAAEMLAANRPGSERISGGPIGIGLAEGTETIYVAVPVSYRVESYSASQARVATWGFTLLGNASTVEPAAYFGLTQTVLDWVGGEWRIAKTSGSFGPTPRLVTPRKGLEGFDLLRIAKRMRVYELAP